MSTGKKGNQFLQWKNPDQTPDQRAGEIVPGSELPIHIRVRRVFAPFLIAKGPGWLLAGSIAALLVVSFAICIV